MYVTQTNHKLFLGRILPNHLDKEGWLLCATIKSLADFIQNNGWPKELCLTESLSTEVAPANIVQSLIDFHSDMWEDGYRLDWPEINTEYLSGFLKKNSDLTISAYKKYLKDICNPQPGLLQQAMANHQKSAS